RLGLPAQSNLPNLCACGFQLSQDNGHFHSCRLRKRREVTVRHDRVVRTLASLFRRAGAMVHIEPRIFGQDRLRPDLDIILPAQHLLVDVTIVHPSAPSYKSDTALSAASAAERFLGFALETFGAI